MVSHKVSTRASLLFYILDTILFFLEPVSKIISRISVVNDTGSVSITSPATVLETTFCRIIHCPKSFKYVSLLQHSNILHVLTRSSYS